MTFGFAKSISGDRSSKNQLMVFTRGRLKAKNVFKGNDPK